MGIAKIRRIAALAVGILMASCMQHRMALQEEPALAGTITFHNNGRDRIQVYLIGEKEDWLLGRLEPLETAHLRLPESPYATGEEAVVLAVLPGWARSLAPRGDRRVTLSLKEYTKNLPGEEWIFVNGQLQGPR
jgi:hypothetical protein